MPARTVHRFLDEHGVDYEVQSHERVVDAQRLAATEHVTGWKVAKPVMLIVGDELTMAVVPAAVSVDLDKVRRVLGRDEVRLAREDEFADAFPDCEPGAEPPFGNLYGLPVLFDPTLGDRDQLVCRDGSHTETVTLVTDDYLRLVEPRIVDISTAAG
ncbi:MAG: YbaK/EbsC family protein [Actinobacteria bacterium]|nr:YbaK/EbsC family protein [Actinomycetota bacterium]